MPKIPYKAVGDRLKKWVERNYESIAAFGRATGKNSQFWYQYFNGSRRPGPDTQNLLRKVNCDVEYIMTGNYSSESPSSVREPLERYESDEEIAELKKKIDALERENTALRGAFAPEILQVILNRMKKKE
jgi:transcriptional regulator with XRE-family HTH domain